MRKHKGIFYSGSTGASRCNPKNARGPLYPCKLVLYPLIISRIMDLKIRSQTSSPEGYMKDASMGHRSLGPVPDHTSRWIKTWSGRFLPLQLRSTPRMVRKLLAVTEFVEFPREDFKRSVSNFPCASREKLYLCKSRYFLVDLHS